jgi:hypothetical protein
LTDSYAAQPQSPAQATWSSIRPQDF